jgi:hypothetical protein
MRLARKGAAKEESDMYEQIGARAPSEGPERSPWTFLHPPHGTCVTGCALYERCHCGCGGVPTRSAVTYVRGSRYRDQPYVFLVGHHMRVMHPRAGAWSRRGVPVDEVRPLLRWLRQRHGGLRAVADLVEVPEATLHGYLFNTKRKTVPPATAKRIVTVVLAHKRPSNPLDSWEEPGVRRARGR